jgi:aminoglycoside phosphotransferase (APT) family kinase protein
VREPLDWPRLEGYLSDRLADAGIPGLDLSRPMAIEQFAGGHSNLTYLLHFGPCELVLRRPPFGPIPPTAHDMAREYRWLTALHPVYPYAPKAWHYCEDPSVIGAHFYLMERRRGVVLRTEEPAGIADCFDMRATISGALVDAMADLHAIDVSMGPIAALGKPAGFVERQVRGWTDRWEKSQTGELPEMEMIAAWLLGRMPPQPARPTAVHGDFKLDNVMLDANDFSRLVAVFDWEMCALGDPLVDVGILLAYWTRSEPPEHRDALTSITDRPGWFTRDEIVERYAARSGRDLSAIAFYETFALFKIAVVIQQIYARYARGQTDDPRFARFDIRVAHLARQAAALAERA